MSTVLTGDRPTGPLHLGHYAGSIRNRLALQGEGHDCFLLVADLQALTDNFDDPGRVERNVLGLVADYLACGIDPSRTAIVLQSGVPELAELFQLYAPLVTVERLSRIPTIKAETEARGFGTGVPYGFLGYPVSQAADITGFDATAVPAGADQAPLVELTREIVKRLERIAGKPVLRAPELMQSHAPRLPGISGGMKMSKSGGMKMSKSGGNALFLGDSPQEISRKVKMMFTDTGHLRVSDPGRVEGNVVFACLRAFDPFPEEVEALAAHYERGGLGDGILKKRLEGVLQDMLAPIRAKRERLLADQGYLRAELARGTAQGREQVAGVLGRVRSAFRLLTP